VHHLSRSRQFENLVNKKRNRDRSIDQCRARDGAKERSALTLGPGENVEDVLIFVRRSDEELSRLLCRLDAWEHEDDYVLKQH